MSKPASIFFALLLWGSAWGQSSFDIPAQSVSASKQFRVYCDDTAMRVQVASFVESIKQEVLKVLNEADRWKTPIVVLLAPPPTADGVVPPSSVRVFEVETGMKIQIDVALRGNLAEAQFPRQIVRALLLELACRIPQRAGAPVPDPPPWLVAGILAQIESVRNGTDSDVYRTLVDINRHPSLQDFLSATAFARSPAAQGYQSACSLALVRLLMEMPNGRSRLGALVRNISRASTDRLAELRRFFPELGQDDATTEKWWTLSLAKLSAAERFKGLTLAESDERLTESLSAVLPGDDSQTTYSVGDFKAFLKSPHRVQIVDRINQSLILLQAGAHPLLRPVVDEYANILAELARGKTRNLEKRIAEAEDYRKSVVERAREIADYLNWYEATQITARSDAFSGYLRMAAELASQKRHHKDDPIDRYLDSVEAALAE